MNVYWFQQDLRMTDHPLLHKALKHGPVIGLYCFDPSWFEKTTYGFHKKSQRYVLYVYQTLLSLKEVLKTLNIDLYIVKGNIDDIIKDISKHILIDAIYAEHLEGYEEALKYDKVKKLEIPFIQETYHTLYDIKTLPYDVNDIPDIFTHFRKDIEYKISLDLRVETLSPQQKTTSIQLDEVDMVSLGLSEASLYVKPGIQGALDHLSQYFFNHHAKTYKDTRNGMLRFEDSTKFSLYLALGVLSPKMIMKALKQYELDVIKNDSTYWIYFELLWRDYFYFTHMKYGHTIFSKDGLFGKNDCESNPYIISKWIEGQTGFPLIDANMRLLKQTGYMSNRGRQNVANFFTKVLKQDWRIGAAYFESQLLDYDVSSNTLNWLYVSGLGNDPREQRLFNVVTQGERYDVDRRFVYTLCEELKEVPKEYVYKVHLLSESERVKYGITQYPKPVVKNI